MSTVRNIMPAEPGDLSLALTILRLSRGWSQDRVAKATGITNSALSEYERGKKVPELKSLQKIVAALGYRLSAIERTEDFLRELRAEGLLAPGEATPPSPLRARARRVAAQMGQAATGFSLLLFEAIIERGEREERGEERER
jgi:transcriptional regulator with XRE-family HTH domain